MSESLEVLGRSWFEKVWNEANEAQIDAFMAPDAKIYYLNGDAPIDRDGFHTFYRMFHGAFPDVRVAIDHVVASGDKVSVWFHFTATHSGDHLGIPATNRPVKCVGTVLIRYKDGIIVEGWNCLDMYGLMQQIGG